MDEARTRRFEAAWEAHGGAVYRLALVYLGRTADAEDVTQEAFCRLLDRSPAFADGAHEKRWLLQVTANLCRDQLKSFWRRQAAALAEELPAEGPEEAGVWEAVLALPETYRGPIHLHYYEGYSVAEVAALLRLTPSAVKMRLKRGRELLRLELEKEELP